MQKNVGRYALICCVVFIYSCDTLRKPQKVEGSEIQLESCAWRLKELMGKKVYTGKGTQAPFLEFSKADTVVQGSGGCNSLNGKYAVHDDLITFKTLIRTERICSEDRINVQENQFFQVLEATEKYKIKGSTNAMLELYKDKDLLAVFEQDNLK